MCCKKTYQMVICYTLMYILLYSAAYAGNNDKITSITLTKELNGVCMGMPLETFVEIHPDAKSHPMERVSVDSKVNLNAPNQILTQFVKEDSLFNLSSLGTYRFKDAKLESALVIWTGTMDKINQKRDTFVVLCQKEWGKDFKQEVIKQDPGEATEHLLPALVWQKDHITTIVACTVQPENKNLKEGALMVCVFKDDNEALRSIFNGENVTDDVKCKLFNAIGVTIPRNDAVGK